MHQSKIVEFNQSFIGAVKHNERIRHAMVEFVSQRRELVADRLAGGLLEFHRKPEVVHRVRRSFLNEALLGIVCAPKGPLSGGLIQLGVSFPFREEGVRVRSAIAVCEAEIAAVHSPWNVAAHLSPTRFQGADDLLALVDIGRARDVSVGFFGSAALQAITDLPYFEPSSDIDIVVAAGSVDNLRQFHRELTAFARKCGRRIDAEVTCAGGRGVKLEELMSNVSKVLCRGMDGVCLMERHLVLTEIEGNPAFEQQKH